jgi:hypothetical protein
MAITNRIKAEKENLNTVERELQSHGVQDWSVHRTRGNHLSVKFEHQGRRHIYVVSASGDWFARTNARSQVRALLEGRR